LSPKGACKDDMCVFRLKKVISLGMSSETWENVNPIYSRDALEIELEVWNVWAMIG